MDSGSSKENKIPNPREKTNPISRYLFTYTIEMFKKGYSKDLDVNDLYSPISNDESKTLGDKAERMWKTHLLESKELNKEPSLKRVVIKAFWKEIFYLGYLSILTIVVRVLEPYALGKLLEYFKTEGSTISKNEAYGYAAAVAVLDLSLAIITNQVMVRGVHYGMRFKIFCCSLIYRKVLNLNTNALEKSASGKVINLLSNDVNRFDNILSLVHFLWAAPLLLFVVMLILYTYVGYAGIIGIAPIVFITVLQSYTAKLTTKYRKETAQRTDERIRLTEEVVSGIQVIKMYAWEVPFVKLINWARNQEIKVLTKSSYIRGMYMGSKLFTTRIALFCTILAMFLSNQEVTASTVFVTALFFNSVTNIFGLFFVRAITETAEVLVSFSRIQDFLLHDEFSSIQSQNDSSEFKDDGSAVVFKNCHAQWNSKSGTTLKDFNLKINEGELYGVIGPVGSGKTSLLQAILGELKSSKGTVYVNGKVSYSCQDPWLFSGTVRQNIIFGSPYDKNRYDEVVRVCALTSDFQQLPEGDLTIIGDHGRSLSGGQKARVNLARAVYKEADIYLLDDPLSAVDVHVAKILYDECINGFLASKTRIVVTHQIYLLKNADQILFIDNGEIKNRGTFQEISSDSYIKELKAETEPKDMETEKELSVINAQEDLEESAKLIKPDDVLKRTLSSLKRKPKSVSEIDLIERVSSEESSAHIKPEASSKGKVKGNIFLRYHRAGGNLFFCFLVFLLFFLTQASTSCVDYYLTFWTNKEAEKKLHHNSTAAVEENWPREVYVYVYVSLIVMLLIFATLRSILFYKLVMTSSIKLLNNLFENVLYTTMRFFDTTPAGRILNRFSRDAGSVDEPLPRAILDAGQIILQLTGAVILVIITIPYMLFALAVMIAVFYFIRKVFLKSSKNIKRLEGITKGPVFTHMNSTLQGLPTIRAYGTQAILIDEFDKLQDYHTSSLFMYLSASSAFGFVCDLMCALFTGLVTFSCLFLQEHFLAGDVGLAVSQAASLTGFVQWGMKQSGEVVNQLISVERILEYETLPRETQPEEPKEVPKTWPETGKIVCRDMKLKYGEGDDYVLKNWNVSIKPQEKVGVVGRTGAGKSSLIAALFRLTTVEGDIEIDQINTKDIILQNLRARISIIPQDPVLFSGTLRYNLDPFGEHQDADLYKAINDVELRDPTNKINNLDYVVADKGGNYSVGQRQLICLARALVRKNKILILDEATANVDPQTDAVIQRTIREKFADCTVITVAHRLNTIMDSDKIMVVDKGLILEFDHPHLLLQNKGGKFCEMVAKCETGVTEQLCSIARRSYERLSS